ncbi:MAG: DUF3617 domain-containing protein [Pseudomonadota bacterium]
MRFLWCTSLAALALTACGGSGEIEADADGDGTITSAEARAAVERAGGNVKPLPGQYATTITLIEASIPGAPPEMAQMMGQAMNRTSEHCLTPEMAERGFEDSIKKGQSDACTIDSFSIDDGDVAMKMTCSEADMAEVSVDLNGTVTPTSSDMIMAMDGTIPQLGAMQMKMGFKQERIGECPG